MNHPDRFELRGKATDSISFSLTFARRGTIGEASNITVVDISLEMVQLKASLSNVAFYEEDLAVLKQAVEEGLLLERPIPDTDHIFSIENRVHSGHLIWSLEWDSPYPWIHAIHFGTDAPGGSKVVIDGLIAG